MFAFLGLEPCDVQPDKIYNRGFYRETMDDATENCSANTTGLTMSVWCN